MLLRVFCDAGDRVLTPEPSYPLLCHLAQLSDVASTPYRLRFDGTWHVDAESVRDGLCRCPVRAAQARDVTAGDAAMTAR